MCARLRYRRRVYWVHHLDTLPCHAFWLSPRFVDNLKFSTINQLLCIVCIPYACYVSILPSFPPVLRLKLHCFGRHPILVRDICRIFEQVLFRYGQVPETIAWREIEILY